MTRKYANYIPNDKHKIKEFEQEENIFVEINKELFNKSALLKRKYLIIVLISIIVSSILGAYIYYFSSIANQDTVHLRSNFLIQNLRGDTVDTWIAWQKTDNTLFHIHLQNSQYATKERIDAIIDVIMSQQKIELDNSIMNKGPEGTSSVYYVGWYGALNSIKNDTKFNIVKNLHFHIDDDIPTGDIVIILTNLSNPDGYSAYTNSIVDEGNHQILKSTITVYDIDKISLEDLKTLVRHELGHGFGLAHSTAPEDLMAPVITTNYPYISECDLDAIHHLYDGGESSKVVCEK